MLICFFATPAATAGEVIGVTRAGEGIFGVFVWGCGERGKVDVRLLFKFLLSF